LWSTTKRLDWGLKIDEARADAALELTLGEDGEEAFHGVRLGGYAGSSWNRRAFRNRSSGNGGADGGAAKNFCQN
jgi:hypothetical protein